MTFKNGIKEYLLTTVLFGIPMGLIFGIQHLDLFVGIVLGALSGFLFTFLIFLFVKFQEKKFDKKREEIAKDRKVICDGGATIKGTGGWMFLTEQGIEFYPHAINLSTEELRIPTHMIADVKTYKNQIIIHTTDKLTFAIVVSHNTEWKRQIESAMVDCFKE